MAINLNDNSNLNNQQQPNNAQQTGTGYTNIQRVLGANQGNQLGNTLGQGVQNITSKAANQTSGAQQAFNSQINPAQQDIQNGQQVQSTLSNLNFVNPDASANALSNIGNSNYANSITNLNGGYKGPTGLANSDQLQNTAQDLQQTAQGLLTNQGRQAALQRFAGSGPNYTQGNQQLDTLLLGQNPDALRQARQNAQQTAMSTNQAIGQANNTAQSLGQQYSTLGSDINKSLGNAESQFQNNLTGRVAQAQAQGKTDYNSLEAALNAGQLSQDQYNTLSKNVFNGLNPTIGNASNTQLANLVNYDPTKYNVNNVATQSDLQSRNALAMLAGVNPDKIQQMDSAQIGQPSNAMNANAQGLTGLQSNVAAGQTAANAYNYNAGNLGASSVNYQQAAKLDPLLNAFTAAGSPYSINGPSITPQQKAAYNALYNQEQQYGLLTNQNTGGNGQIDINPLTGLAQQYEANPNAFRTLQDLLKKS